MSEYFHVFASMSVFAALGPIAVLAILILVHELGHFLAARFQGIYVNRFSLGFGRCFGNIKAHKQNTPSGLFL